MTRDPHDLSPSQRLHVESEVRAQRKLEAVKWVKRTLGISLADAKALVDAVQASAPATSAAAGAPTATSLAEVVDAALRDARPLDAVRAVQEAFALPLPEAKAWVDGFRLGRGLAQAEAAEPPTAAPWFDEPPR